MMNTHAATALGHPVFDPGRQITAAHYWTEERGISACLTVNIGME